MSRVLVLFASHHGQTRSIAFHIAETLRARGLHVHLRDIVEERPDPAPFDGVVVGAPVQIGKHDRAIQAWISRHAAVLAARPGAFFSVSMSAASPRPDVRAALDDNVARFLAEARWHPARVAKFAGALHYSRYDWLTRQVMRLISGSQGRPTDTRRDYEYTDWKQVDQFAADVLELLSRAEPLALVS